MTTTQPRSLLDYVQGEPVLVPPEGTYETFLESLELLGRGFDFSELVKPRRRDWRGRFRPPPRSLWKPIVGTLAAANELRTWLCEGGVPDRPEEESNPLRGLRVAAAYRPTGGATNSQHKRNAALDLDLLPGDTHFTRHYYETAVRFWCTYGRELKMGLGLYCSARARGGIRVHIDTGYHCRCWQISRSHSLRPYRRDARAVSLAIDLARGLDLVPPTEPRP